MGHHYTFNHPSFAECRAFGLAIRTSLKKAQPKCPGQAWQRIPAIHGSLDVGQQMYVRGFGMQIAR
jgi:hypothetical protein